MRSRYGPGMTPGPGGGRSWSVTWPACAGRPGAPSSCRCGLYWSGPSPGLRPGGPGHGALAIPDRAAGSQTPPAAARRVTWDGLMPVSDLHRQIAVLALAAAGEHGFALGGASALLARGVISRPRLNGLQSRLPRGSDQRPPGIHRPPPPAIERATVICRQLAADQLAAFLPDLASSLNNQSNRRPVLWSATTIRWAAFLGRSHPGPGQILASGRLARHASTGAPSRCCLCTNMWITCAQRRRACANPVEMLGITLPGRNHGRGFTWESASRTLCMQRKPELSTCHAAIGNK